MGRPLKATSYPVGFSASSSDFVQVVGLYHQQTERTFQGYVGSGERARRLRNSLVGEERIALVAVADERARFSVIGFQTARYSVVYLSVEACLTA